MSRKLPPGIRTHHLPLLDRLRQIAHVRRAHLLLHQGPAHRYLALLHQRRLLHYNVANVALCPGWAAVECLSLHSLIQRTRYFWWEHGGMGMVRGAEESGSSGLVIVEAFNERYRFFRIQPIRSVGRLLALQRSLPNTTLLLTSTTGTSSTAAIIHHPHLIQRVLSSFLV